jgi:hypothetical protein
MTLDSRRHATGRLLAAMKLALLGALRLELCVLLGSCLGGLASLHLGRLLGALALQAVGGDQSLDLGALSTRIRKDNEEGVQGWC